MKTAIAHQSHIFASRLRAVWESVTTLAGLPVATQLRNERLRVIASHLKRDAAVTGSSHLADVAEQLERIRKNMIRY